MEVNIVQLDRKEDERGWLAEILKHRNLEKKQFGQLFITTAKNKGMVKGNHYHKRKREWFCVIKGKARLRLKLGGEQKDIEMGEGNFVAVELVPPVVHAIKNIGDDEMLLLAYVDEEYDPEDPDTFREVILE